MTDEHDFRSALEVLQNHQKWRKGCDETPATRSLELSDALDAALIALRLADRLQSGDMLKEYPRSDTIDLEVYDPWEDQDFLDLWHEVLGWNKAIKTMSAQMMREIEGE